MKQLIHMCTYLNKVRVLLTVYFLPLLASTFLSSSPSLSLLFDAAIRFSKAANLAFRISSRESGLGASSLFSVAVFSAVEDLLTFISSGTRGTDFRLLSSYSTNGGAGGG